MQTAAMTNHAASTASPRLSATIPNETAPSKATPVHKIFVCHPVVSTKVPIARLPCCSAIANGGVLYQTAESLTHLRQRRRLSAVPISHWTTVVFAMDVPLEFTQD